MPDIEPLAFGIRFALTRETIGREARKLIHSLTEHQLEHLCGSVPALWPSMNNRRYHLNTATNRGGRP